MFDQQRVTMFILFQNVLGCPCNAFNTFLYTFIEIKTFYIRFRRIHYEEWADISIHIHIGKKDMSIHSCWMSSMVGWIRATATWQREERPAQPTHIHGMAQFLRVCRCFCCKNFVHIYSYLYYTNFQGNIAALFAFYSQRSRNAAQRLHFKQ